MMRTHLLSTGGPRDLCSCTIPNISADCLNGVSAYLSPSAMNARANTWRSLLLRCPLVVLQPLVPTETQLSFMCNQ